MIHLIFHKLFPFDPSIKILMKKGIKFSLLFCIVGTFLLFGYQLFYQLPDLYYISLSLIQTGITFIAFFIACAIAFNQIKRDVS